MSVVYKASAVDNVMFELRSLLGRCLLGKKPTLQHGKNYLNLGCGSVYIDGMVNADFFPGLRFWKRKKLEWYLDLRFPLQCDSEVFDGVFTEHTLEHLYPDDAFALLKELFRVMKSGAMIRVTVPDLGKYVDFYNNDSKSVAMSNDWRQFETGAAAIRNLSQNYFHLSLWDFDELKRYLIEAGFRNVERKSFGVCSDPMLCRDLEERSWETLYVEAIKPLVTN